MATAPTRAAVVMPSCHPLNGYADLSSAGRTTLCKCKGCPRATQSVLDAETGYDDR